MNDTELLLSFTNDKQGAWNYRWRRHMDWTEIYMLYRDKVFVNRLTQRQSVNVPLMKTAISTLLKDNDEPPILYFSEKDNDSQKEVYFNELWNQSCKDNKFNIQDLIDKKNAFLFGRTFQKQTIKNGRHWWEVRDPQWILVDRYTNPAILDSAQFLYDTSNYVPLSSLEQNPMYDQKAVRKLKDFYSTQAGLIKAEDNLNLLMQQNERQQFLGVADANNPVLGETYIELVEGYKKIWHPDHKQLEIRFFVIADGMQIMVNDWQEQIIGMTNDNYWRDHYIYTSWAVDPERTDFWSDGIGDVLRTPNKILNVWASQMVENRTLRSYGMYFYDSAMETDKKFVPQTFSPQPGGLYPMPGDPNKVLKHIEIPDLSDSLADIQYVTAFAEKSAAISAANQGSVEAKKYTLGEVQIALGEAKERSKAASALYTDSREEFGQKYIKLLEAQKHNIDPIEIVKKGKITDRNFPRIITKDDWTSDKGWVVEVKDISKNQDKDMNTLQMLNAALSAMPNNKPLRRIYNKNLLELSHVLNANEVKEVTEYEKQQAELIQAQNAQGMLGNGMGNPNAAGGGQPMMLNPGTAPNVPLPA
jgi:hypothetical protein